MNEGMLVAAVWGNAARREGIRKTAVLTLKLAAAGLAVAALWLALMGTGHAAPSRADGPAMTRLKGVAAAGRDGGRLIENGAVRPALTVRAAPAVFRGPASQAGSRRDIEAAVPQPEAGELKPEGCGGFFSCLGGGVVGAIAAPFVTAIAGGVAGAMLGSRAGWAAAVGLGILGAVVGLAVGVILAPVILVGGVFQALGKLFQGKLG